MLRLGPIARNEACRQLTGSLSTSAFLNGSVNPQIIEIWDTGGVKPDPLPSGVDTGDGSDPAILGGHTLLATLQWNAGTLTQPFNDCGAAGDLAGQPAKVGTAYANTIDPDTSVAASGTADYFRILNRNDASGERFVLDGDVTLTGGGGDIEFDDVNFIAGGTVIVTDLAIVIPITCPQDLAPIG